MTTASQSPPSWKKEIGGFEWFVLGFAVLTFAFIKLVAHSRFGTTFDTALFGNVAWRLGSGLDSVSTLTGFQYFATHASGVILILAPIFAISPSTGMLVTFLWQTLSIGLIGLAVAQIASTFALSTQSRRILLLIAVLSPGAFLATRLDIHEPTLGLGFLAMTLSSGLAIAPVRRSWWWPALAAACRIEMAVATIVAGLVLLRKARAPLGFLAIAAGVVGTSFSMWFIAGSGSEAASVAAHFAHLGSTVGEVVSTAISDPMLVIKPLGEPAMLSSLFLWLLPAGIVLPVLGWRYLLVALPMAGVAILGVWAPADQFPHHYWYGFLVGAPIAAAEAIRRWPRLQRTLVLTSVVGMTVAWTGLLMTMPILQPFGRAETSSLQEMVDYVSASEPRSVSAPVNLLPHLAGRAELYAWPRPFLCNERVIGPFAWSGDPPDVVLLRMAEVGDVESDRILEPLFSALYIIDNDADLIAPFRLRDQNVSGLSCR